MKVVGIVVEYNPFHFGHQYHIEESKRITGANAVIAVMSGNFLQRGEPAIVDKWARTEIALSQGVDLVIELPVVFSCHNAGVFAKGAISILHSTGIVDYLVFGSEYGNIENLLKVAKLLANESQEFKKELHDHLKDGISYPEAQNRALSRLVNLPPGEIGKPNNILGIEYLKQLVILKSSIKALTIKRLYSNYHDREIKGKISSATAIRELIMKKGIKSAKTYLPPDSYSVLKREIEYGKGPIQLSDFCDLILYQIRKGVEIPEAREGIENRIKKAAVISTDIEKLIKNIKTKRYTKTKIQRMLIHILLGLSEHDNKLFQKEGPKYIRVLGFTETGRNILKQMKLTATLPIILKAHLPSKEDQVTTPMLKYDIRATWIYALAFKNKSLRRGDTEFKKHPIYLC
ncbi:MAG: nucleotidyltransferase [Synergistetes bacterium]|nr:nucleotidyltransferase [Synergistota bacterium]